MWEKRHGAVYDLPCGLRWTSAEQRKGEYGVSLTTSTRVAPGRVACGQSGPTPDTEQAASTARLARLVGIAIPVAARLLESHGSLVALQQADAHALRVAHGLTERQVVRLQDALDLAMCLLLEPRQDRPRVTSPHDAARLVLPEMGLLESEQMRVLLLNTKNRLIAAVTLYKGTVSECHVRVAELFREAVRRNATALILLHNHPSGASEPSPEDVQLTREVVQAGRLLDVNVLDHLVIGKNAYTSLRERGDGWA